MNQARKRDEALEAAFRAAGGAAALAVKLGISKQAVSDWLKCPHRRVLQVEALTGVPRTELRPDLYPAAH